MAKQTTQLRFIDTDGQEQRQTYINADRRRHKDATAVLVNTDTYRFIYKQKQTKKEKQRCLNAKTDRYMYRAGEDKYCKKKGEVQRWLCILYIITFTWNNVDTIFTIHKAL